MGDFKDQNNPPEEHTSLIYLRKIEKIFQQFDKPTYHVLGNHDMDSISKKQFLTNVTNHKISTDRSYYAFDLKGLRFIVLDANFSTDGKEYDHGDFDRNNHYFQ